MNDIVHPRISYAEGILEETGTRCWYSAEAQRERDDDRGGPASRHLRTRLRLCRSVHRSCAALIGAWITIARPKQSPYARPARTSTMGSTRSGGVGKCEYHEREKGGEGEEALTEEEPSDASEGEVVRYRGDAVA